ncbi:MAG: hypothetical protein KAJ19_12865 [Gammaproteobacteria bacterium]|nr:hypothetical protein [Gammaproteobacteria bacterium]
MSSIGGSIRDISIKGRLFPVAADADINRKLGGFEVELAANGDGSARKLMTRVPWQFDGLVAEIDDDRGDQEFLQDRADEAGYVACTITFISGHTYQGDGSVVGELQYSSAAGTATLSLGGPGRATKQ